MDLQIIAVERHDIGQMNLYLGYFAAEENAEGDNLQARYQSDKFRDSFEG
jgi:hypothetical protein